MGKTSKLEGARSAGPSGKKRFGQKLKSARGPKPLENNS